MSLDWRRAVRFTLMICALSVISGVPEDARAHEVPDTSGGPGTAALADSGTGPRIAGAPAVDASKDMFATPDLSGAGSPETGRKIIATGFIGGAVAGSLVSSYFDWWKDNAHSFHFVREGVFSDYSLGIDKIGHAYTSYFYFHAFREVMLWGGFGPDDALWWASGASAFFAVSVEIGDGLSRYGFSFEDLGFNLAGLGFGLAQVHVPFLRHFHFKWSFVPRGGFRWPPRFTDHYDAHTYWVTMDLHGLFPDGVFSWWPSFLHLALGYGGDESLTRREFVVGLDLHLGAFEGAGRDLGVLQRIVSMIHLPGPAVKFTERRAPEVLPIHLR